MKFVSCRVRPGFVDVERICDMRMGRPVRVERRRRVVSWRWPVNWMRVWCESDDMVAVFGGKGGGDGVWREWLGTELVGEHLGTFLLSISYLASAGPLLRPRYVLVELPSQSH
jgi:hypothetical protein